MAAQRVVAAELVVIAMQCQRGECPVDPDLGVDWASVDKFRTDVPRARRGCDPRGAQGYVDPAPSLTLW